MKDYILSEDLSNWLDNKKYQTKEVVIERIIKRAYLKEQMSKELKYHLDKKISLTENVFRYGSDKYFNVINEAREFYRQGFEFDDFDKELLESDLGTIVKTKSGKEIPLDMPFEYGSINEAEYQGKKVELNKPKSGGSKKWYVYVRNPKTGKIKKVSYGSPVMTAKWNDPEARKSFAARHQCEKKKDKTKAGYWACRAHKDFGKNVSGRFW